MDKICRCFRVVAGVLYILIHLISSSTHATAGMITVELDPKDRTFVKLAGIVGPGDFDYSTGGDVGSIGNQEFTPLSIRMQSQTISWQLGNYYNFVGSPCLDDAMFCAVPERIAHLSADNGGPAVRAYCATVDQEVGRNYWVQFANRQAGTRVGLRTGSTPTPPSTVLSVTYSCQSSRLKDGWGVGLRARMSLVSPSSITVVDPSNAPPDASFCTLTSLPSITFMASKFDVSGTRRSETLHVRCSDGVPQNYTIRLLATSTTSTGGRLLFDSGVSAQISLNGQNLEANGEKHVFPNLTTTDILLAADLVGSSSGFGVSSATGVLILEIQ